MSKPYLGMIPVIAALLCAAACGDVSGPDSSTADVRMEDTPVTSDTRAEHQIDTWTETLSDVRGQDLAGDIVGDVGDGYGGEPQLMVLLPAFVIGRSAGGGWELSPLGAATTPTAEVSAGGIWRLSSAIIGGTP